MYLMIHYYTNRWLILLCYYLTYLTDYNQYSHKVLTSLVLVPNPIVYSIIAVLKKIIPQLLVREMHT